MSDEILSVYVSSNILAGSDTTAVVLRAIVYYITKTDGVLARLVRELDESRVEYPVSYKAAKSLGYLDAVIREAMCIHCCKYRPRACCT